MEPTEVEVRAAIKSLPDKVLLALAEGPNPDPSECGICDSLDPWLWGPAGIDYLYDTETGEHVHFKDDPAAAPAAVLSDYHDFYADNGRGQKAYDRCQLIYTLARDELVARGKRLPHTPMGSQAGRAAS